MVKIVGNRVMVTAAGQLSSIVARPLLSSGAVSVTLLLGLLAEGSDLRKPSRTGKGNSP